MKTLNADMNFRIDKETKDLLRKEADSRGLKPADIIRQAIREYVFAHKLILHEVTK